MKKGRSFYTVVSIILIVTFVSSCSKKDHYEQATEVGRTEEARTETSTETSTNSLWSDNKTEEIQTETAANESTSNTMEAQDNTTIHSYNEAVNEEGMEENKIESNLQEYEKAAYDSVSTFSIDVDTAGYSVIRSNLQNNFLPNPSDVRLEELINYFHYDYPNPKKNIFNNQKEPFEIVTNLVPCPWNDDFLIAGIGINGEAIDLRNRPSTNLVFLMDVSGSMNDEDKLPLLKESFKLLVNELGENDRVSIVVYAGASGVILKGTRGDQKDKILQALDELEAGGSTNGSEGMLLAYDIAKEYFIKNGNNRVILATDGDFNVGLSSQDELLEFIEEKREDGIFLSALGFGADNRNFETMELLADNGNGQFAYIDSEREARKVLVEQLGGTLYTIAKDVKIQVEFNPAVVSEYALLGYDNRLLEDQEFNDDRVDAGDIGAGHQVTALYMVRLKDGNDELSTVDLRYQSTDNETIGQSMTAENTMAESTKKANEVMFVKLRYKEPKEDESKLIEKIVYTEIDSMTPDLGFALCVAEFGLALRGEFPYSQQQYRLLYDQTMEYVVKQPDQYKIEFVSLIEKASNLVN